MLFGSILVMALEQLLSMLLTAQQTGQSFSNSQVCCVYRVLLLSFLRHHNLVFVAGCNHNSTMYSKIIACSLFMHS